MVVWTKTKADFVLEIWNEHFGPRSTWEFATAPAHKGTQRRVEFDRINKLLSELIGCTEGGLKSLAYALTGKTWDDANGRKWTYWLVAKAIEIDFMSPDEAPAIAHGNTLPDEPSEAR